jgi:hypothetical protein
MLVVDISISVGMDVYRRRHVVGISGGSIIIRVAIASSCGKLMKLVSRLEIMRYIREDDWGVYVDMGRNIPRQVPPRSALVRET